MPEYSFLLYGANGYTGELIARRAASYGLYPLLAGRDHSAISRLARELNLPFRIFELNDEPSLQAALAEVPLVVHAAGPYHITALPMIHACINAGIHYTDLNGDLSVFEHIQSYHQKALQKGVMLLPGAGFDVVPTDCLAFSLKKRLPDANFLQIAFSITGSRLSRGTAISTLHQLGQAGATRIKGNLHKEPVGKRALEFSFPGYPDTFFTMSIPWGDLSTAFYSTGIPNIETYTGIGKFTWRVLKAQKYFNGILRSRIVHRIALWFIKKSPAGPDTIMREKAISLIYAKATNANKEEVITYMRCPEPYAFTAEAVLVIALKIVDKEYKPGYQTPASAYGEELLEALPVTILH